MSTQAPVNPDSLELQNLLTAWQRALRSYTVRELVVLGPDPYAGPEVRRVLAAYPDDAQGAAQTLADSADAGSPWEHAPGALLDWQHLARPPAYETAEGGPCWRRAWRASGARSVVRVRFALPAERAFECFLFSHRELENHTEMGTLAWTALQIWPALRAALVALHCPLTERELQCLVLAFDGLTARASAARLECSERTVNYHLAKAMAKLGVDTKMAAIQRACWFGAI